MAHSPQLSDSMIRKFDIFLMATEPWLSKVVCDEEALTTGLLAWKQTQPDVRVFSLEGKRMRSAQGFYGELIRSFGLPAYFGRNFNALSECLTDADILEGKAFVIFVRNGDQLLCEASPEMLEGFLDTLRIAGAEWATPVKEGQVWDRDSVPFHTLIQMREEGQSALSLLPSLWT